MSDIILKAVQELGENMKSQLDTAKGENANAVESVKSEITTQVTEVKSEIKVVKDEVDAVKEQVTEMMKKNGRLKAGSGSQSFGDQLGEQLEQRKAELSGYGVKRNAVNFEVKAVGNMGSSNVSISGTDSFVGAQMLGGVGRKPYEVSHIRDFVQVTPVSSDAIFRVRDQAGEGGPTAVLMAAAKPQSDRDYQKLIVPVTKIAHYFKIPEEMLKDIAWLQNEITAVGVEELYAKEDDLFLNQTGSATLFAGLTTSSNSTAYSSPASLLAAIDNANNYDVLVAAWTQLKTLKGNANLILCNPADYARMILTKESSTNGAYVFGAPNVSIPNVFGIPLVPHNAITSDKFLLGDFSRVQIAQRDGLSVRFYDQNEDDAIKNMVTIVIEERVAISADRNDRIIYGDFSDARTALETA
jgi:HK97 family phage major capsid protein